ncbi:MAG: hypothetical protein HKM93_03260 [Desulfobacteraceae bacterium]|nr:hypothetical protein [Desulfobacteraceae bacterium]
MREFVNKISGIIQKSGLKLNRISKASGISHTYLTKLVHGNINRPGKDKIASILLAMNYSIGEINAVLAEYDYRSLNGLDIPSILVNNRRRKIEGNTLSLYDSIHMRLLLSPLECIGGTKIMIKGFPTVLFMPEQLYMKEDEGLIENDKVAWDFRMELTRAIFRERRQNFADWRKAGNRSETYMCRKCFSDFLKRNLAETARKDATGHRDLMVQFFVNVIVTLIREPDQHIIRIVELCPYFDFFIQDAEGDNSKLFFIGRKYHEFKHTHPKMELQGFTSDSAVMIDLFAKETEMCRLSADENLAGDYPFKLVDYFYREFEAYGLGDTLRAAVDLRIKSVSSHN